MPERGAERKAAAVPVRVLVEEGQRWTPSEQVTMADGQLGSVLLDGGPEEINPEGTADIARPIAPRPGKGHG